MLLQGVNEKPFCCQCHIITPFGSYLKSVRFFLCMCVSAVCRACSPCSYVRVTVCYYECVCTSGGVRPHACLLAGLNFTPSWRCSNIIMCDQHMRHEMSKKTNPFYNHTMAHMYRCKCHTAVGRRNLFLHLNYESMLPNFLREPWPQHMYTRSDFARQIVRRERQITGNQACDGPEKRGRHLII